MTGRPVVTLYRGDGCTLCDHAAELLNQLASSLRFTVEAVDIAGDDTLLRRYMLEIPVIAINGEEIARAPIRRQALEHQLHARFGAR